jgi:hypothetical protein
LKPKFFPERAEEVISLAARTISTTSASVIDSGALARLLVDVPDADLDETIAVWGCFDERR